MAVLHHASFDPGQPRTLLHCMLRDMMTLGEAINTVAVLSCASPPWPKTTQPLPLVCQAFKPRQRQKLKQHLQDIPWAPDNLSS
jgi:hypothetical protein